MKKILAALDSSPRASHVLASASALAAATGAELYLLRTIGLPPDLPDDAYRLSPDGVTELLRANAARDLEHLASTIDPKVVVHILVRIGVPWGAILEAAKQHEADLIVIGSHGYTAIDHVLGTTAAKLVNHADRSVLVVRGNGGSALLSPSVVRAHTR